MKTNSLAAKNEFLKKDTSGKSIIRNVATSTSIETGKQSGEYDSRCSHSGKFAVARNPKSQKK
jgi:hypothetical protein